MYNSIFMYQILILLHLNNVSEHIAWVICTLKSCDVYNYLILKISKMDWLQSNAMINEENWGASPPPPPKCHLCLGAYQDMKWCKSSGHTIKQVEMDHSCYEDREGYMQCQVFTFYKSQFCYPSWEIKIGTTDMYCC